MVSAWTQQELGQPEAAVKTFGELIRTWPEHSTVPSAMFYQARGLADLKRFADALPLLEAFRGRYPDHKLGPDAQFLLGWLRLQTGDPRGGLADLRAFVKGHPVAPAGRRGAPPTERDHGPSRRPQRAAGGLPHAHVESPARAEGLWEAAAIAAKLGRESDQHAAWRKLRTQFPDHPLEHARRRSSWPRTPTSAKSGRTSWSHARAATAQ